MEITNVREAENLYRRKLGPAQKLKEFINSIRFETR